MHIGFLSDSNPSDYYFQLLDGTLYGLKVETLDEWNMKKIIYIYITKKDTEINFFAR